MKAVGMGELTGSKVRSRGHQWATGGSALIPPPLHQSEYSHPRLGLFFGHLRAAWPCRARMAARTWGHWGADIMSLKLV